ncbi:hypothetical protein [Streptomyces sp. NPDC055085]
MSTPVLRRPGEHVAIAELFSVHGLPSDSAEALSDVSRLRRRTNGRPVPLGGGRAAYFLVDGCVAEQAQPGKVRLWRDLMLFERISDASFFSGTRGDDKSGQNSNELTVGTTLSRCLFIEVPHSKLASRATSDPAVALLLARMATKRYTLTEQLYTATRAAPIARVAALLNYLAEPTRRKVIKPRKEDGAMVIATTEELVAAGPSQADIADALCLGRATVEKAIAELRQIQALRSFKPGERANRCYPIKDRQLLRQISMGG